MEQSIIYQLTEWIKGNSLHNNDRDECCPDFSCCQPELAWEIDLREEFMEADDVKRNSMKIAGKLTSVQFLDQKSRLRVFDGKEFHEMIIDDFTRKTLDFQLCMNTTFVFEVAQGQVIGVEKL